MYVVRDDLNREIRPLTRLKQLDRSVDGDVVTWSQTGDAGPSLARGDGVFELGLMQSTQVLLESDTRFEIGLLISLRP